MNVTLRQLRAFVALVRTGSFTSAAGSLHITQSAFSGLIKELEQVLGVQMVIRSTRRVQLSEVGQAFYPLASKMLQDLDGALHAIADIKALTTGIVRIAAPQLMACTLLPEIVAEFRKKHPAIQVRLSDCVVEGVLPKVHSGEVDFGIGPERSPSSEILARQLFEMPFVAVFPKKHPLGKLKRITWNDAVRFPLISLQGEYTHKLTVDLQASHSKLALNPSLEVAFMTTALSLVKAEQGITTCLPYAMSLIKLYRLEARLLESPRLSRKFHVFVRKDRALSPAAAGFVDFLFSFVSAQDWTLADMS